MLIFVVGHEECKEEAENEVLVTIDMDERTNKKIKLCKSIGTFEALHGAIHEALECPIDDISHVQLWSGKFQKYAIVDNLAEIQDGCLLNVCHCSYYIAYT